MPAHFRRSVLVTGCSSGIGHHVAHELQRRGWQVFATARREADLERLRREGLEKVLFLDLDDSASIQAAAQEVLAATDGKLYGLFNNAAYGQPGAVEDLSRAALRAQLETNLLGTHELTCTLIPAMRRNGRGRIIQNSSILGFAAMPYRGAYNCSKFALEGLTDTLRLELRGTGIEVSLIEPGPIRSRFRENAYRKFLEYIDAERSPHRERYRAMVTRLQKEGDAAPFTLGPEAVLRCVVHALESRRPRVRYRVTVPTHLFAFLKRVLPDRWLDDLLVRASGAGRR